MAEFDTSSGSESIANLNQGLRLFDTLCSTATEIAEQASEGGEEVNGVQLFDQTVDKMALSKQEALTLWAALEIAVRAVRRASENIPLDSPPATPDTLSPNS